MADKQNSPISKTARLLDLVPFLLSHQNIPLEELSAQFGISQKEMIEDLNTLWMCGLPGYTPLELIDLSFESGIVSISNADVLKEARSLSVEEIMALLLGLDILKASLQESADRVEEIIKKLKVTAQGIVGHVVMLAPSSVSPLISLVKESISWRREIVFSYHSSSKDQASFRRAIALEIFTKEGVDYIEAFCLDSQGFRTFRCDRISELQIGQERSESIPLVTPVDGHSGRLRIHSNPRDALEKFALDVNELSGAIGTTHRFSYFNDHWVERMAISSSGDVEILEPASVRSGIAARASALLDSYKSGD